MPKRNETWLSSFPMLEGLDQPSLRRMCESARLVTVPAGSVVFQDGTPSADYTLVVEGVVRVQKLSETGREIVLYRVEAGQSCVLNTSSLMTGREYGAEAIAETDVTAILLPSDVFHSLLAASAAFRRFVFSVYSTRISDLLCLIEEVAFGRIDVRLAQLLTEHAGADSVLKTTHQELAVELGTAREVISRQLKEFERRGWLRLFRGRIELADRRALAELANKTCL